MSSQLPLSSNMLTIFCWILGANSAFSVNVRRDQSVYDLKETIMSKKRNAFKEIDADNLVLWRMDVKSKQKKNFQESRLHDQVPLDDVGEIGVHFNGNPLEQHIHIVIKPPGKYGIYLLTTHIC